MGKNQDTNNSPSYSSDIHYMKETDSMNNFENSQSLFLLWR